MNTKSILVAGLAVVCLTAAASGQLPFENRDHVVPNSPPIASSLAGILAGGTTVASNCSPSSPHASPYPPPQSSDRLFVECDLSAGCRFRSQGPITVTLRTTRYLGATDEDGYLMFADDLVAQGYLEEFAILEMPVWDVDVDAETEPPYTPEFDEVYWNGERVDELDATNRRHLDGDHERWQLNRFRIPIDKVKFPRFPGEGVPPIPGENEIEIHIDVGNAPIPDELWCTDLDWVSLRIGAMSPIIMIHGSSQSAAWWGKHGYGDEMDDSGLVHHSDISLVPSADTLAGGAAQLAMQVPRIAVSFGVDSIHLVAHSKGGLDVRHWMEHHLPRPEQLRVLSFSTLSAPHDGSILADLLVEHDAVKRTLRDEEFIGAFPPGTQSFAKAGSPNASHPNLTKKFVAPFNRRNVRRIPPASDLHYYTIGADMDADGSGTADPPEATGLEQDISGTLWWITTTLGPDIAYQIIRNVDSFTIAYSGLFPPTTTFTGFPTVIPQGNDVLVSLASAAGRGGPYSGLLRDFADLVGPIAARNHSTVGDRDSCSIFLAWQLETEKMIGDLQP